MAKGMKSVMPQAAALNISTGEMFSSFATLTSMGEDSTKAMRGLGTMFQKVAKPSKNAAELAKNLGIEFNAAALQSKGLAGFITDVTAKTGGNTEILTRLFEDVDLARMMRKLGVEGAAAFTDGLSQMENGAAALQEFHDKSQDSIAERWEGAVNRMKNTGAALGAAFMPVFEKIVDKIGAVTAAFTQVDTSKLEEAMNSVAKAVGWAIDSFINAVKFAWQFRGVIIAVVGAIIFFTTVMKAIEIATRLYSLATSIATGFQIAYAVVVKGNTAATLALGFATNGVKIATTAWTVVMKIGILAQKGMAAAQWLVNAALTENPIGLVIAAIAALIAIIIILVKNWDRVSAAIKNNTEKVLFLISIFSGPFGFIISMVKELISNWDRVKEAFADGGILKGILKIGQVLLSGILAPVQGLLEILSYIPGLGKLAGKGAEKIAEFRNSLLGEDANITAKIKIPKEAETALQPPDLGDFQDGLNSLDMPSLETPEIPGINIDIPEFAMPDMSAAGGINKSPFHGVEDISKGPGTITHLYSSIPENGSVPFTETAAPPPVVSTAPPPTASATPPRLTESVLHIESLVAGIEARPQAQIQAAASPVISPPPQSETVTALLALTSVVRHIDASASGVLTIAGTPLSIQVPELAAVAQALRTTAVPAGTGLSMGLGRSENTTTAESPRNTAPITREERAYSLEERRDKVDIELSAAQGTSARVTRRPRSANVSLTSSGGNA
jgi:hypothetical protein